jgi:hypothetical protein
MLKKYSEGITRISITPPRQLQGMKAKLLSETFSFRGRVRIGFEVRPSWLYHMNTPPSYFDLPILEVVQIMEIIKERGE